MTAQEVQLIKQKQQKKQINKAEKDQVMQKYLTVQNIGCIYAGKF